MICPYCNNENKNNGLKCYYCNKYLLIKSYLYPADTLKSNFEDVFVFEIDRHLIEVKYESGEYKCIKIFKDGEEISKIHKIDFSNENIIDISGHSLSVRYIDPSNLFNLLLGNSGFKIYIDDIPLEKTASDPINIFKNSSRAFYYLSAMMVLGAFLYQDFNAKIGAILFAFIFSIFGFFLKKLPILIGFLGSLFALFNLSDYIYTSITTFYYKETINFMVWLILRCGITIAIIQALIVAIKIKLIDSKRIRDVD